MQLSSKSIRATAVSAGLAFSCAFLFPIHAYSLEPATNPVETATVTQAGSVPPDIESDELAQQPVAEQHSSSSTQGSTDQSQPSDSPAADDSDASQVEPAPTDE